MRTTIDLPDDLHRLARSIAHDSGQTVSETIARLIRRGLAGDAGQTSVIELDELTGLPLIRVGRPVGPDDVRSLDDE